VANLILKYHNDVISIPGFMILKEKPKNSKSTIRWRFTTKTARIKLLRLYPSINA